MANPDRWVSKILALPIFDEEFREAVQQTPFAGVAFISAMDVESGAEFAGKVLSMASSLEVKVVNTFQGREVMLEQLWSLVVWIEKTFFESTRFRAVRTIIATDRSGRSSSTSEAGSHHRTASTAGSTAEES